MSRKTGMDWRQARNPSPPLKWGKGKNLKRGLGKKSEFFRKQLTVNMKIQKICVRNAKVNDKIWFLGGE